MQPTAKEMIRRRGTPARPASAARGSLAEPPEGLPPRPQRRVPGAPEPEPPAEARPEPVVHGPRDEDVAPAPEEPPVVHGPREEVPEEEPEADYGEPPASPEEMEVEPETPAGNGSAGPMPDVAPHLRENAFEEWQTSLESFLRNLSGLPKSMFAVTGGNIPAITLDNALRPGLFRQLVTSEATQNRPQHSGARPHSLCRRRR